MELHHAFLRAAADEDFKVSSKMKKRVDSDFFVKNERGSYKERFRKLVYIYVRQSKELLIDMMIGDAPMWYDTYMKEFEKWPKKKIIDHVVKPYSNVLKDTDKLSKKDLLKTLKNFFSEIDKLSWQLGLGKFQYDQ